MKKLLTNTFYALYRLCENKEQSHHVESVKVPNISSKYQTPNVTDSNKIIETHFARHSRLPLMIIASICILETLISGEPNFPANNNCLRSLPDVLAVGELTVSY
ncbi:hypothetical protein CDAR_91471 [Caerostris darwini]|uniref:Uncharacterized protein n=1 Tax=Caerostris darwini TaxID=1538125 RepID=A0AAV4WGJ5_9ARAC|nr:hypothetical protein CDAR_91471 [Caerostris darwini]